VHRATRGHEPVPEPPERSSEHYGTRPTGTHTTRRPGYWRCTCTPTGRPPRRTPAVSVS
jgi:hypothetical protein